MPHRMVHTTGNSADATTHFNVDTAANVVNKNATGTASTGVPYVSATFTVTNAAAITGIALFLNRVDSVAVGTMTVNYRNPGGTTVRTVTVNNSDIPNHPSWCYFQFASTYSNVTTISDISITTTGTALSVYGTGLNVPSKVFPTTTTGALVAGDTLLITGRYLSVAAPTSASYIVNATAPVALGGVEVGSFGSVDFSTSVNNPLLNVGFIAGGPAFLGMFVWGNAALRIGTIATPIPATSIAVLNLTPSAETDTKGLCIMDGGYFMARGQPRAFDRTEVAVSTTSTTAITFTATDTVATTAPLPWTDSFIGIPDEIVVSGGQTSPPVFTEFLRLGIRAGSSGATVNVNAAPNEAPVNLTALKSGEFPWRTKVGLMTRNIKIYSSNVAVGTFIVAKNGSFVDVEWVQIQNTGGATISLSIFGGGPTTVDRRGIAVSTGATAQTSPISNLFATASFNMRRCAIGRARSYGVIFSSSVNDNIVFSDNIIGQTNGANVAGRSGINIPVTSGTNITINNNLLIGGSTSALTNGLVLGDSNITFNNNVITNHNDSAIAITSIDQGLNELTGNVVHHCLNGIILVQSGAIGQPITFSNTLIWHVTNSGIRVVGGRGMNLVFKNITMEGCTISGIGIVYTSATIKSEISDVLFQNCKIASITIAGVNAVTPNAFYMSSTFAGIGPVVVSTKMINCIFGDAVVSGNRVTNVFAIQQPSIAQINLENCKYDFSNQFINLTDQQRLIGDSFILSQRDNQVSNTYKGYFGYGTVSSDTTAYAGATGTHERLTPNSATFKLRSSPKLVAVAAGGNVTVNVKVRKSVAGDGTAYNGLQPKLVLKRNDSIDGLAIPAQFTTDFTLATAVGAAGSFETLTGNSGTAGTPGDNGVFEFYVDCDGTAGWVNLEDWSTS